MWFGCGTYNVARSLLRDWICDVATAETLRGVLAVKPLMTRTDRTVDTVITWFLETGRRYEPQTREPALSTAPHMVLYTDEESLAGVSLGDLRQETLIMLDMTDT